MSPLRPDLVECWIYRQPPDADPEFLLIRRAPGRIFAGLWQCVTGGLEPGERVPMAALREVREEIGFGPAEIEAFYDLDQVTQFYDEGSDAIVTGAIFAMRVGPNARAGPLPRARRAPVGGRRGGGAAHGLADVPGDDRADHGHAAGPAGRAVVPAGPRGATAGSVSRRAGSLLISPRRQLQA